MAISLKRESQLSASFVKNLKAVFPNVDVLRLQTNKCVLRNGLPDLMCIGPWGVHFIECKRIGIPWKTARRIVRLDKVDLLATLEKKALSELSLIQRRTLAQWVEILPSHYFTACWLLVWWLGDSLLLEPMSWFKLGKDKEGGLSAMYDEGRMMCTDRTAVKIPTSWRMSLIEEKGD